MLTLAADDPGRFARIVVAGVGANLFRDDGASDVIAGAVAGDGDPANPVVQYFAGLAAQPGVDRAALGRLHPLPSPTPRRRRPRQDHVPGAGRARRP